MKALKTIGVIAICLTMSACFLRDGGNPDCISTREKGCLSPEEFRQQAARLAEDHRAQPNFSSQWGLATIRADQAYGNLALLEGGDVQPGAGQTIGVIDSGIDTNHPLFQGKNVTEEFLQGASDETGSEVSHGTGVASVIAGNRLPGSPSLPHGVAWGADLAVFAMTPAPAPLTYEPISLAELKSHDAANAAVFKHVLAWEKDGRSIDFVNFSVGYEGIIDGFAAEDLRANYGQAIAALAQEGSADKTVTVWSAGNAHGEICTVASAHCVNGRVVAASPELLPGLPLHFEELRGHHIAVAAVGRDGTIADWSNRCGSAADWCIAAPGEDVEVAYFGPDSLRPDPRLVATADGTSFSAPMVTGGLAVMKHFFRGQLTNTDLVARMFATADRTGEYADKAVYGQGLLDLGAATSPVGTSRVALGSAVGGRSASLPGTVLASGGALGDGLSRSLAGTEIAAFDSLGAPFWFDLGDFVPTSGASRAAALFGRFMASARDAGSGGAQIGSLRVAHGGPGFRNSGPEGPRLGLLQAPAGVDRGHLGLAEHALAFGLDGPDGLAAAAFSTEGMHGLAPASGAMLSWRGGGMPAAGLRVGWLAEREELLGTSAAGAFGGLSAESIFAAIEGRGEVGGWELFGSAEIGTVTASPNSGLIADVSPLTTSAFTLNATRALGRGTGLDISISQPLRVESGQAALSVPAGRTGDGRVLRRRVAADLSPSGQQIDVMTGWHWRSQSTGNLRLAGIWSHHPGHRAGTDPELAFLASWQYAF